MATSVGSLYYDLTVDDKGVNSTLAKTDAKLKAFADNSASRLSSMHDAFDNVASGLGKLVGVGAIAGTAIGVGLFAATKAAWDQVDAVQQATVGLKAYEKDGNKVNDVLNKLVAFARSDMGVLFNRKDLFAAAQGLKIMGDNTDQLTAHVEIMARSVGLGLSTWDDLTRIIGRVGSTGRLAGEDFDNLTKAGYKLDPAMRNTNVTFDSLFKALDKGIPVSALEGNANTIKGLGVKMQTAFRGMGEAILGVDKDTGKFINGGLGDKLVGMMSTLANLMKDPALTASLRKLGSDIADFAIKAIPVIIDAFKWIVNNSGTVIAVLGAITAAWIGMSIAATVAAIAEAGAMLPFYAIAAVIVAVIAVLTFLQIKFGIFTKIFEWLWQAGVIVQGWFNTALTAVINFFVGIFIGIVAAYNTYLAPVINAIVGAFIWVWNIIATVFGAIFQIIWTILSSIAVIWFTIWQGILTWLWNNILSPILNLFISIFTAIWVVISTVFNVIWSIISSIFGAIWNTIWGYLQRLWQVWSSIFNALKQPVMDAFNWIRGFISGFINIGGDIINGILQGINRNKDAVINKIKEIAQGAVDAIKRFFGIKSPSKLMALQGDMIMQGLGVGIENGVKGVVSSATSAASQIASQLNGNAMLNYTAQTAGGGVGSTLVPNATQQPNVTVNVDMNGIMARSRSDLRFIARDMITAVNEELKAKGKPEVGI